MNLEKEIFDIALTDIMPNRFQPREIFDDDSLLELAESIKQHGVIQPIIVRKIGDKYELIAGERRYRASAIAGKETIPALVRDIDDKEAAKIALLENLQRKDLTPIEEAKTYQTILKLDNITQDELAQNLGKSQSAIANKLRLLNLDEEVQTALLNSQISERHARSLLSVDNETQKQLLNKVLNERLTVRQLDEEIMKITGKMPESEEQEQNVFFNHNIDSSISDIPSEMQNNVKNETPINTINPDNNLNENNIYNEPINTPYTSTNINTNIEEQPNNNLNNVNNIPENYNEQVIKSPVNIIENNNEPQMNIPIEQTEQNLVNNQVETQNNSQNFEPEIPQQPNQINNIEPVYTENIFDKLRVKQDTVEKQINTENIISESNMQMPNNTTIINSEINNNETNYNNIYDLRFAINNFRQAVQNTEKFGFKVKSEEIDEPNSYKIIIEIDK